MKRASWIALALACAAGPAAAQEGWSLGVGLGQNRVAGSGDASAGAAVGVTAGYGLSDRVALFGRYGYGYRSSQVDAGARYTFRPGAALRPYLELAATRATWNRDPGVSATGGGLEHGARRSSGFGVTAAAGVEYTLSPGLSLDVALTRTQGRFTRTELGGAWSDDASRFGATRLGVGFRWRP